MSPISVTACLSKNHCHIGTRTDSITQHTTATLLQALTLSHNRALPHWNRHSQYHTTEHCHIGTGTNSITQHSTATLVQALTVPHNRPLRHWYMHWHYHTTEHCHIGTNTDSNTKLWLHVPISYTIFVHIEFQFINSKYLATCVKVSDPQTHPLSWTNVTYRGSIASVCILTPP